MGIGIMRDYAKTEGSKRLTYTSHIHVNTHTNTHNTLTHPYADEDTYVTFILYSLIGKLFPDERYYYLSLSLSLPLSLSISLSR